MLMGLSPERELTILQATVVLDDDSSVVEGLPVHGAVVIEGSVTEDSDSAQDSTTALQDGASVMAFTWEDMAIYVGRREQFIGNSESESESCYD
jgi:hypothetical protein